jgi:AcrR family transcriptional regulator
VVTARPRQTARSTLAKQEAEQKALMRAAYRLMDGNPSGPTSLQDILDAAGLSTRAFYRSFGSKDELLVAMHRIDSQWAISELYAAVASSSTPRHSVVAWIDHWMSIIFDQRRARHLRVLTSAEARNAQGMREVNNDNDRESISVLTQVLSAGLRSGDFPSVEPTNDARAFQAVVTSLVHARMLKEHTLGAAEAARHLRSLIGRALGCSLMRL